jgi:hypothetical protein
VSRTIPNNVLSSIAARFVVTTNVTVPAVGLFDTATVLMSASPASSAVESVNV